MGIARCERMKLALLSLLLAGVSASGPPPFFQKAANARWLVHKLNYAVLSTNSVALKGAAFGNPQSFSDGPVDQGTGKLFFYVSSMDASMQDIAVDPKCSLSLSLEMLGDYCTQEWAPLSKQIDPEDPRCTRLTLLGSMRNVTDQEFAFANSSLMSRHPSMASWPADHHFHLVTLDIEAIWLIDMFGGASVIKPNDYFAVKPATDASLGFTPSAVLKSSPPAYTQKPETARWMAHNLTFGVMSTTSVQYPGYAFGNPQSFIDGSADNGTGRLYFYVSDLDASMKDIKANPTVSFTLSEEFSHGFCSSAQIDPEDPRCARLVFSGAIRNTTSDEGLNAKANLFARHPGMKKWPSDHSWQVVSLDLTQIWLIDFFGGATLISVDDYFKVDPAYALYGSI